MKTILEANQRTYQVLGKQKIKELSYRLMKYVLRAECQDGLLLYNIVTEEMILLDPSEEHLLQKDEILFCEEARELIERRYLVPMNHDEKKLVKQLRSLMKKAFPQKSITGYTILPTTSCNARCFYCYESDYPHITMDEKTAHDVVRYIVHHCGDEKTVHISWFGGEPLVAKKIITKISDELAEEGISFSSSMISNGYLFTEDLVQEANDIWKLRSIQITLDGTEEVYNEVKAYQGTITESPFIRVLRNIHLLLDSNIYVSIRMNMDKHNYEDLKKLIELLAEEFSGQKNFSANVAVLFDDAGFEPVTHTMDDKYDLEKKQVELEQKIRELGLVNRYRGLPGLKIYSCMAERNESAIINPNGEIAKCEHYIFDSIVGDIYDEKQDIQEMNSWKEVQEWDSCRDCILYPNCITLRRCSDVKKCSSYTIDYEIHEYQSNMIHRYKNIIDDKKKGDL